MLIRNSLLYIASKIAPGLLGMATTGILTRLLAPEAYGRYGLALVIMSFGGTTMFDWLGLSFLRFYQGRRDDPRVISTFIQLFALVVLLTLAIVPAAWALGAFSGEDAPIYAVGVFMMWCFAWFEFVAKMEVAKIRPFKFLIMNLGRAGFMFAGAVSAAWLTRDPIYTALGVGAGILCGATIGGFGGWSLRAGAFDRKLAVAVAAFGLPIAASMVLSSLVTSGTRALLGAIDSAEALGLYTAAFMLIQNTLTVASSGIAAAGYSLAVRAVESGDADAARAQLLANGTLLFAVLAPAALGMALTAHGIAETMVGADYVDAVAALAPWMALGSFFAAIRADFLDHAFQLGHRPNLQIHVTAVAAAIAIGLCLWLIPARGPVGAAIAISIAMGVSCVHAIIAGRRAYTLPLPIAGIVRIAAACGVMALAVLAVPGSGAPAFIAQVAVGGLAYGVAAVALDVLGVRARLIGLAMSSLHRPLKLP